MRLIDADALLKNVKRGVYTDDLSTTIAVDICKSHIEKMPTIDAIPVEWLHKKREQMIDAAQNTPEQAIAYVLCLWKKEQGAR